MFPFLIGRIRTIEKTEIGSTEIGFPFLIGRIRTFSKKIEEIKENYVSIPHR